MHFTLVKRVEYDEPDEVGRTYYGWWEGMSEQECYRVNRHLWLLGPHADSEHYAIFSAWTPDRKTKLVRLAIEIDSISPKNANGHRSVKGRILNAGHPVYDEYVGKPSPVPAGRPPVRYFESPFD